MVVKAGDLDRRIVIESETITRSATGAEVISWATLATVWAKIEYRSGTETDEADQPVSLNKIFFLIRFRDDLTARMRIKYKDQYYSITFIENLGREVGTFLHTELRDHD